jgi:hypothetical protein
MSFTLDTDGPGPKPPITIDVPHESVDHLAHAGYVIATSVRTVGLMVAPVALAASLTAQVAETAPPEARVQMVPYLDALLKMQAAIAVLNEQAERIIALYTAHVNAAHTRDMLASIALHSVRVDMSAPAPTGE